MTQTALKGACLCGAVQFRLSPPIRDVIICHCRQCAKWTGHAVAAAAVTSDNFKLLSGEAELRWFESSSHAQRGFCGVCGSSLFWKPADGSRVSVLAGSLDPPTGLSVSAHIFVEDKSDYYEIADQAQRFERGAGSLAAVPGKG